jgi:hypothetical protein
VAAAIAALWAGRMPLGRAFWGYAVFYGLLINAYATLISFAVLAAAGPPLLAIAMHLLPIPWSVITAVGVWRSAGQAGVPAQYATLARAGVIVWSALLAIV